MIKKLAFLLPLVVSFIFAETSSDTVNKKDKAEVKQIEQSIIKEKQLEAEKQLEEQKAKELEEQKTRDLNMQHMAQINTLLAKISTIDFELKDNILLKRYSNYL